MMQVRDPQARPVEAIRSGLPTGLPELVGQLLDKDGTPGRRTRDKSCAAS